MIERQHEIEKYRHVYATLPDYRMGDVRALDARKDVRNAFNLGARSYLDIGCGRGEMLKFAKEIGFETVTGAEAVPELCAPAGHEHVINCRVDELGIFPDKSCDLVTSFDVLEHLIPGDDLFLIQHAGRIAKHYIALTANNLPSVDPTTGADLHINIRTYDDWHDLIAQALEPQGWRVERMLDKQYVSETWRAWR